MRKRQASFSIGTQIGITCIIAPFELISNDIITGTAKYDTEEIAEILNIQIEAVAK